MAAAGQQTQAWAAWRRVHLDSAEEMAEALRERREQPLMFDLGGKKYSQAGMVSLKYILAKPNVQLGIANGILEVQGQLAINGTCVLEDMHVLITGQGVYVAGSLEMTGCQVLMSSAPAEGAQGQDMATAFVVSGPTAALTSTNTSFGMRTTEVVQVLGGASASMQGCKVLLHGELPPWGFRVMGRGSRLSLRNTHVQAKGELGPSRTLYLLHASGQGSRLGLQDVEVLLAARGPVKPACSAQQEMNLSVVMGLARGSTLAARNTHVRVLPSPATAPAPAAAGKAAAQACAADAAVIATAADPLVMGVHADFGSVTLDGCTLCGVYTALALLGGSALVRNCTFQGVFSVLRPGGYGPMHLPHGIQLVAGSTVRVLGCEISGFLDGVIASGEQVDNGGVQQLCSVQLSNCCITGCRRGLVVQGDACSGDMKGCAVRLVGINVHVVCVDALRGAKLAMQGCRLTLRALQQPSRAASVRDRGSQLTAQYCYFEASCRGSCVYAAGGACCSLNSSVLISFGGVVQVDGILVHGDAAAELTRCHMIGLYPAVVTAAVPGLDAPWVLLRNCVSHMVAVRPPEACAGPAAVSQGLASPGRGAAALAAGAGNGAGVLPDEAVHATMLGLMQCMHDEYQEIASRVDICAMWSLDVTEGSAAGAAAAAAQGSAAPGAAAGAPVAAGGAGTPLFDIRLQHCYFPGQFDASVGEEETAQEQFCHSSVLPGFMVVQPASTPEEAMGSWLPFVLHPSVRPRPLSCIMCGRLPTLPRTKLLQCTGCRAVRYCGEACRDVHWPQHRLMCAQHGAQRQEWVRRKQAWMQQQRAWSPSVEAMDRLE